MTSEGGFCIIIELFKRDICVTLILSYPDTFFPNSDYSLVIRFFNSDNITDSYRCGITVISLFLIDNDFFLFCHGCVLFSCNKSVLFDYNQRVNNYVPFGFLFQLFKLLEFLFLLLSPVSYTHLTLPTNREV